MICKSVGEELGYGHTESEMSKEEKTAIRIIKILIACFFDQNCVWNNAATRTNLLERRICPEANLYIDLGLDFLDVKMLALVIEEAFQINLKIEEEAYWNTIEDMLNTIVFYCYLNSNFKLRFE